MFKPESVPGDIDIRAVLRPYLEELAADHPETVFIEELGLRRGEVRIDVAVVNGVLHGYEIKSDRDRLNRLPIQVDLYNRILDHATLVVGSRHLQDAVGMIPSWWGVLRVQCAPTGAHFEIIRRAGSNPEKDPRALVELLWRDDALHLLEARSVAHGVRSKPRPMVWDRVCEHFDLDEIAAAVRDCLRSRAAKPAPA